MEPIEELVQGLQKTSDLLDYCREHQPEHEEFIKQYVSGFYQCFMLAKPVIDKLYNANQELLDVISEGVEIDEQLSLN